MENLDNLVGKVKWFNNQKSYGFIVVDGLPDIMVHYSAIQMEGFKTLTEGEVVTLDVARRDTGLAATRVERGTSAPVVLQ